MDVCYRVMCVSDSVPKIGGLLVQTVHCWNFESLTPINARKSLTLLSESQLYVALEKFSS